MNSDDEQLIRPSITGLTPYSPGKPIAEVQRELGLSDIIKLASNENPLGPSPLALQAMERAVREVRLYPENDAPVLRQALSEKHGVPPEQIIVGRGSDEVIHMLGLAFLNPGEEVIMDEPPFTLYEFTAQLMGGVQVRVPMRDFACDIEAMAQRLSERTKIIFIANPNNPAGSIVRRQQIKEFMQRLPSGAIAVFDEAYREYADDPEFPDSLEYVRRGANAIVLRTFSKIYALAGLRIGYGMAPLHLAKWVARVREPFNVSSVAQEAALASLQDANQVARSVKVNREGKEYLSREFERLRLKHVPTQANFMLVDVGRDCREVFRGLLQRGVIVRTCDIFGFPNHIRVTIGTMEQNQRFIQALEQALQ
jgi:histidinol-phosphate aminotransferase